MSRLIIIDSKSPQLIKITLPIIQTTGNSGGGTSNPTNLAYTASPTQGVVTSDTGTDATIPAGSATNASLMLPADKTKLDGVASGATANSTDAQLRDRSTHTGTQAISTVTGLQTALDGKQATGDYATNTALTNGLAAKADLVGGLVPANQLPSFVDDVLEYANLASFPATGESGKIYIALDTNQTYRWSGSIYAIVGNSLALGETSLTAYRGDRGKTAYDHSQLTGNPHGTTKSDVGLANVDNTSDATKNSATATLTNKTINLTDNTLTGTTAQFNTALSDGDFSTLAGTETLTNKTLSSGTIIQNATGTTNAQTGTTHTLLASDNGKIITLNNASAITLTVPSGLGAGFNCTVIQKGIGQVTFTASGTTIVNRQSHTKTAGQHAVCGLYSDVANNFYLTGDTTV